MRCIFFNKIRKKCEGLIITNSESQDGDTFLEAKRKREARKVIPGYFYDANNVLFLNLDHEKIKMHLGFKLYNISYYFISSTFTKVFFI